MVIREGRCLQIVSEVNAGDMRPVTIAIEDDQKMQGNGGEFSKWPCWMKVGKTSPTSTKIDWSQGASWRESMRISHILDRDGQIGETLAITTVELPGAPDRSMSAASATKALLLWAETNFKKTSHFTSLPENTTDFEMIWVQCDRCIVRLILDFQSRSRYLGEYNCSTEERYIMTNQKQNTDFWAEGKQDNQDLRKTFYIPEDSKDKTYVSLDFIACFSVSSVMQPAFFLVFYSHVSPCRTHPIQLRSLRGGTIT